MFEKFLDFVLYRDMTKWYTFSVFDLMILAYTGVKHFASNGEDSCILLWIAIIGLNAIGTYFHNQRNK